jgi:hypothetical protein
MNYELEIPQWLAGIVAFIIRSTMTPVLAVTSRILSEQANAAVFERLIVASEQFGHAVGLIYCRSTAVTNWVLFGR